MIPPFILSWLAFRNSSINRLRQYSGVRLDAAAKARAEQEAAARAATQKVAEAKAPPTQVASVQPGESADALYQQGLAAENEGDLERAVKLYRQAARQGSGPAAKRHGDIYQTGKGGVARDYQELLRWYAVARKSGELVRRPAYRFGCLELARRSLPNPAVSDLR